MNNFTDFRKLNGLAGGLAGMVKGVSSVIPKVHGTVQNLGCAVLRRNKCAAIDPTAVVDDNEQQESTQQQNPQQLAGGGGDSDSLGEIDPNMAGCVGGLNSPKNSIMTTLSLEKFESR